MPWDAKVGRYVEVAASSTEEREKPPVKKEWMSDPKGYEPEKRAWFARNVPGIEYSEHEYHKACKRATRDPEKDNDKRRARDSYGKSSKQKMS